MKQDGTCRIASLVNRVLLQLAECGEIVMRDGFSINLARYCRHFYNGVINFVL